MIAASLLLVFRSLLLFLADFILTKLELGQLISQKLVATLLSEGNFYALLHI